MLGIAQASGGQSWPWREPTSGEGADIALTSWVRQKQCPAAITDPLELGGFHFLGPHGHEHLFSCPTNSPVPASGE